MEIIYLRVSTEDQNPLNQLKECRTLSINNSSTQIIEENQSAWKEDHKRTEFNKLLKLLKSNYELKTLIVWDLDRIYRNRKKLKQFFEICKLYKVQVLSYRQKWLNDFAQIPVPFDEMFIDFFINLLGWMAEEESSKKSDRVKIAYKNHKGEFWGRSSLPVQTIREIIIYYMQNQKPSIRKLEKIGFEYKTKKGELKKVSRSKIGEIIKDYNSGKVSIKSPLENCVSFINKFDKIGSPEKEQLKDK